jgi:hypothetical protein
MKGKLDMERRRGREFNSFSMVGGRRRTHLLCTGGVSKTHGAQHIPEAALDEKTFKKCVKDVSSSAVGC